MKNLINIGDFRELLIKGYQKGLPFILGKFMRSGTGRTVSAFNKALLTSNWWIVDRISDRLQTKITDSTSLAYETYASEKFLSDRRNLHMLSVGCGVGNHEIRFAETGRFSSVTGIDIAPNLIDEANQKIKMGGHENVHFHVADAGNYLSENKNGFDVILFHSSLHHFNNVEGFIYDYVIPALKVNGMVIINEYVGPNRLQWTADQLRECNRLLQDVVPESFKRSPVSWIFKRKQYAPGIWRMWLSDPSEAPDSESIRPAMSAHFEVLEEKEMGGNILHPLLKDIAHHFVVKSEESVGVLEKLILAEENFIEQRQSDFLFGVYRKK